MVTGKGGSILVHIATTTAEREGTTVIVRTYRQLVRTPKHTRVEPIVLSLILPVVGSRGQVYQNCRRMAINTLIQQVYVGKRNVDLWGCFVGKADMLMSSSMWKGCSSVCG